MRRLIGVLLASGLVVPALLAVSATRAQEEERGGGTLVVVGLGRLALKDPLLDPQQTQDLRTSYLSCCLARALMGTNGLGPDEGGDEILTDLAASEPEISRDGLTWTFHLKRGLRYAPPLQTTEITAKDIVRALERVARLGGRAATFGAVYSVIEGFEAFADDEANAISGLETPDRYTLVVHLNEPTGDFAARMAAPASAPIAPVAGRRLGVAQGHADLTGYLVSSGPYMFESAVRFDPTLPPREQEPQVRRDAESFTLVRNPSWDPSTDGLRLALPDRIVFDFVPPEDFGGDEASMIEELVRRIGEGEADVPEFGYVSQDVIERNGDSIPADRVHVTGSPAIAWLILNLARSPFDDLHVRRAVAYLLDREGLREGYSAAIRYAIRPASHILPDEAVDGLLFHYAPWPDRGDLALARREMAASRYDGDGDGVCDGEECIIDLPVLGFDLDEFIVDVATQLEDIGIRARFHPERSFEWEVAKNAPAFFPVFAWPDLGNPASLMLPMLSGPAPYVWGFPLPSIEERLRACLELVGPIQTQCWARLDQYLMEQTVPVIPFGTLLYAYPTSERVIELPINVSGVPQLDRVVLADS